MDLSPSSRLAPPARSAGREERLRVLAPDLSRLPAPLQDPDPQQSAVLRELAQGRSVLAHAGPGAGRTSLALTAALASVERQEAREEPVLLLSPRRTSADPLRDAVALAGAASAVRVATPAAAAFALVRQDSAARGLGSPSLVTGAEQDLLLASLIAERAHWELEVDPAVRLLPGFRAELRDAITRAEEMGLSPADLRSLAIAADRPAWLDAAGILQDYLDVLDLESAAALDAGPRLDSGALVRRAARLVLGIDARLLPRRVIVDDAQDLTAAGCALIAAFAQQGAQILLTACPDAMVDAFRGALPDAAERIAGSLPHPPVRVLLAGSHRLHGEIRAGVEALRSHLPLAGAPSASRHPAPSAPDPVRSAADAEGPDAAGELGVLVLSDPLEEARVISSVLRDVHHRHGVPYDDMAVICRSTGAVEQVADLLSRCGLAVSTPQRTLPLREEPVVADLLRLVEIGTAIARAEEGAEGEGAGAAASGQAAVSPLEALELLRGPFGDADTLRLRRIRRLLLDGRRAAEEPAPAAPSTSGGPGPAPVEQAQEEAGEETTVQDSASLLAWALLAPEVPELLERGADRTAAPVHRLRRMVRAVADLGPSPAAAEALWAAWEAARLAEGWQSAALGQDQGDADGARSRLTAHRLDAVTALFAAADRFTDRRPQADALVFVDQVRSQTVAEDTLAPRAEARGRVSVLTPAQIAGSQRDTIVLARVQEGAWPNMRLRSTLLGAAELSLLGSRATGQELPRSGAALRALQREQVLADELRLVVSALARARSRALVTAVEGAELIPSAIVERLRPLAGGTWPDPAILTADPGPAPDPRRLVAALRRSLASPEAGEREESAQLLSALAAAGVEGADPRTWYHQLPSSEEPLRPDGGTIALSPSALERAHACPQAWLLERSGGSAPAGPAQLIGTAVHRLAQEEPAGVPPEQVPDLLARLQRILRPLRLEETWSGRQRLAQAEDAVVLLQDYLRTAVPALATEAPFSVQIGPVHLRGIMDRLEGQEAVRVVDLKTGKVPKSAAQADEDLQLAAYQTAVADGALEDVIGAGGAERISGAQLVYVGTGGAKPAVRTQKALRDAEDPGWFGEIVGTVAQDVAGSRVRARRNSHCDRCAVRRTCALWPEGEEL